MNITAITVAGIIRSEKKVKTYWSLLCFCVWELHFLFNAWRIEEPIWVSIQKALGASSVMLSPVLAL